MTSFDPTHIVFPVIIIAVLVLQYSGRMTTGKVTETAEGMVFALKPMYLWTRILVYPLYAAFFLWVVWRQHHGVPWPIVFLFLIFIAIGLLQLPGTIILTPAAVIQRFWVQPSKTILYGEIMTLQTMQAGRTTLVLGDNRVRIRHSANHSASIEFQREMERRTGKRAIT